MPGAPSREPLDRSEIGHFSEVDVIRILIAEDEERISRFIEKGLRAAGFAPTVVADGVTAVDYASGGQFDLLLLDVGLPRLDGFTVLAALRQSGVDIPVIILTARDSAADTVAGLDGGADDYMAKPFRFEELVARIRRRVRPGENNDPPPDHIIRYGILELNLHTRAVSVGERTVELSAREFALVEMFLLHPGQVLSRQQLLSHVWGYDFDGTSNVVDVYVRQLRQKIGADHIVTTRGAGYRLAGEGKS
ncbi:DNA-binding response OmpR family regulator [Arthrobacter sp. UYEF3]